MKMNVLQTDLGVTPAYKKQPPRRASSWVADGSCCVATRISTGVSSPLLSCFECPGDNLPSFRSRWTEGGHRPGRRRGQAPELVFSPAVVNLEAVRFCRFGGSCVALMAFWPFRGLHSRESRMGALVIDQYSSLALRVT
jgi:hypothetical protein